MYCKDAHMDELIIRITIQHEVYNNVTNKQDWLNSNITLYRSHQPTTITNRCKNQIAKSTAYRIFCLTYVLTLFMDMLTAFFI
jgi:hypothetical protein